MKRKGKVVRRKAIAIVLMALVLAATLTPAVAMEEYSNGGGAYFSDLTDEADQAPDDNDGEDPVIPDEDTADPDAPLSSPRDGEAVGEGQSPERNAGDPDAEDVIISDDTPVISETNAPEEEELSEIVPLELTPPPVSADFMIYDGQNAGTAPVSGAVNDAVLDKMFTINVPFPAGVIERTVEIAWAPWVIVTSAPGFEKSGNLWPAFDINRIAGINNSVINPTGTAFVRDSQTSLWGGNVYNGKFVYKLNNISGAGSINMSFTAKLDPAFLYRGSEGSSGPVSIEDCITVTSLCKGNPSSDLTNYQTAGLDLSLTDLPNIAVRKGSYIQNSEINTDGTLTAYLTGMDPYHGKPAFIKSAHLVFSVDSGIDDVTGITIGGSSADWGWVSGSAGTKLYVDISNYYSSGNNYKDISFNVHVKDDVALKGTQQGIVFQAAGSDFKGYFSETSETPGTDAQIKFIILGDELRLATHWTGQDGKQIQPSIEMEYSYLINTMYHSETTKPLVAQTMRYTYNPSSADYTEDIFRVRTITNVRGTNIRIVLRDGVTGAEREVTIPGSDSGITVKLLDTVFDGGAKATATEYIASMILDTPPLPANSNSGDQSHFGAVTDVPVSLPATFDFVKIETMEKGDVSEFENIGTQKYEIVREFTFLATSDITAMVGGNTGTFGYNGLKTKNAGETIKVAYGLSGNTIWQSTGRAYRGVVVYVRTLPKAVISPSTFLMKDNRGNTYEASSITNDYQDNDGNIVYRLEYPDLIIGGLFEDTVSIVSSATLTFDERITYAAKDRLYGAEELRTYMAFMPMEQVSPDMTPGLTGLWTDHYYIDTFGLTSNEYGSNPKIMSSMKGAQLQVRAATDILLGASISTGTGASEIGWPAYDAATSMGVAQIKGGAEVTNNYHITVVNPLEDTADYASIYLPLPKKGEAVPSEIKPGSGALNTFGFSFDITGEPVSLDSTRVEYTFKYSSVYSIDLADGNWHDWGDIPDKTSIRMVNISAPAGLPAATAADSFSEEFVIPFTARSSEVSYENAGAKNIFTGYLYREINSTSAGIASMPFAAILNAGILSGHAFIDMNGNGTKDADDTEPVTGLIVKLFETGTNNVVGDPAGYPTDAGGDFEILDLFGTHLDVRFEMPSSLVGWGFSTPTPLNESNQFTTLTNVDPGVIASQNLLAGITAIEYDIDYVDEQSAVNANPETYSAFDSFPVIIANLSKTGFTFTGWTATGGLTIGTPTTGISIPESTTGDIVFTAHWTTKSVSVNFLHNHTVGDETHYEPGDTANASKKFGNYLTLPWPDPSRIGYDFGGWFRERPGTTEWDFGTDTIATEGTLNLYAKWTAKSVTVNFYNNYTPIDDTHNETGETANATRKFSDKLTTFAAPSRTGYDFGGWFTERDGITKWDFGTDAIALEGTLDLYAKWTIKTYTVTYIGNEHTSGTEPSKSTHNHGTNAVVKTQSDLAKSGYTFDSWNTLADGTGTTYAPGSAISNITSDKTLYARWTYDGGGGGGGGEDEDPVVPPVITPPAIDPPVIDPPNDPSVIDLPVAGTTDAGIAEPAEPAAPENPTGTNITVTGFTASDEVKMDAQTGNLFADLANGNVPLGNFFGNGAWSLLSLLLSLIAVIISVFLIIGAVMKRRRNSEIDVYGEEEEEQEQRKKTGGLKALTIVVGILTLIVWLILDDLSLPMVWINKWTLFVAIVFVVHLVCFFLCKGRSKNEEGEADFSNTIVE